ncbi:MAG: hypothetical protein M3130_02690 [Actinomycetota bacterium]|nr:hypothetical protein [Actinomycetota bacterium]
MLGWKLVAGAAVAATAFGAGTLAVTPSLANPSAASPSPSPSPNTHPGKVHAHAKHAGFRHALMRARRIVHAEWVTRDGVHHYAIRGKVMAVSPTSITVLAHDGVRETYLVSSDTAVRLLRDGHKGKDAIGEVTAGEDALVAGNGTPHHAKVVVAMKPKPAARPQPAA